MGRVRPTPFLGRPPFGGGSPAEATVAGPATGARRRPPHAAPPLGRRLLSDPASARRWVAVIVLALVVGGFTAQVVAAAGAARSRWGDTRPVWVTRQPVAAGAVVPVRAERWPTALIPDGALTVRPVGARAAGPLDAGAPLTRRSLAHGGGAVPRGRRTVAIALDQARLPARVGDRVDVWATGDPASTEGTLGTQRVATDAVVVRITGATAVVAVSPREVAEVAGATALGSLTLVGST